ncbi:MAG: NAD(+)/NADH kinase [Deltaproteobacteria bacterium]|nr:NAD(+)/NADH kinase [Deltaproteobacteria bacterium]
MRALDKSSAEISEYQVHKAGIIIKKDDPIASSYARKLQIWLSERKAQTSLDQISSDLDILIILGGDGTLLHCAETAARYSIPVIGINLGNLGFLTELSETECAPALEEILAGTVSMENRQMLKARLIQSGSQTEFRNALNDVVINKNTLDRLLYLSTKADDDYITTYKADGLIFSTPTGSTAYSLSAGGPLVHPGLATILVTPICPFMLSSRPIILPPDRIITSKYIVDKDSDASAKVIIDGQAAWEMYAGDILEVQTAEHPLQLITSKQRDYFTILRNKLKWGSND